MDLQSPLTQQHRPDYFEPKIVTLYRDLFRVSRSVSTWSDVYWRDLGCRGPRAYRGFLAWTIPAQTRSCTPEANTGRHWCRISSTCASMFRINDFWCLSIL